MKKCPLCAEEIQDLAIKCRHCGEMLNGTKQSINPSANDGTATARAVMKGLKQKDWHDSVFQIRAFFALLIAVIVGFATHNAITGFVVFVLLGAWIRYRYYHE